MSRRRNQLLAENNRLEKELSRESQAVLTDIAVYLRGADISCYEQERVRRDIIQMVIDGEQRGYDARTVIGEDYQAFCDNVICEIPELKIHEKIIAHTRDILPALSILTAIWTVVRLAGAVREILSGERVSFVVPVTLGELLSAAVIAAAAWFLVRFITRGAFQALEGFRLKWMVLFAAAIIVCAAANIIFKNTLFSIHLGLAAVIAAGLYGAYKLLDICTD